MEFQFDTRTMSGFSIFIVVSNAILLFDSPSVHKMLERIKFIFGACVFSMFSEQIS